MWCRLILIETQLSQISAGGQGLPHPGYHFCSLLRKCDKGEEGYHLLKSTSHKGDKPSDANDGANPTATLALAHKGKEMGPARATPFRRAHAGGLCLRLRMDG